MPREKTTFSSDFKRFFLRGLAILLPSVLTLWIVWQAYLFLDRQVAEPINRGLRQATLWVIPKVNEKQLPSWFVVTDEQVHEFKLTLQKQGTFEAQSMLQRSDENLKAEMRAQKFKQFWDDHWYFRFIGLLVAVTLIYLAGRVLGGFIGRQVYQRLEYFLTKIPILKQVYPHVKQVVDLIFGEKQIAFKKVVFVQYPRQGIWSIGFVTSSGMHAANALAGGDSVTVFIPSTPTPFTGFTITVRRSEAMDVPITVDEALRFVLTGGVLVPGKQAGEPVDTIGPGGPDEGRALPETGSAGPVPE